MLTHRPNKNEEWPAIAGSRVPGAVSKISSGFRGSILKHPRIMVYDDNLATIKRQEIRSYEPSRASSPRDKDCTGNNRRQ
jgi:hypothetical protein